MKRAVACIIVFACGVAGATSGQRRQSQPAAVEAHNADWAVYRGDPQGTQYADLAQIHAGNVHRLVPGVGILLVGVLGEPLARSVDVAGQHLAYRHWGVESSDFARATQFVAEHILRPKGHLLRLDHTQERPVHNECVISRPVRSRIFLDGVMVVDAQRFSGVERNNLPTARAESGVDSVSPRAAFAFRRVVGGHRSKLGALKQSDAAPIRTDASTARTSPYARLLSSSMRSRERAVRRSTNHAAGRSCGKER